LDGGTAELGCTERGKSALECADRRARHADDDDWILSRCGHVLARVLSDGLARRTLINVAATRAGDGRRLAAPRAALGRLVEQLAADQPAADLAGAGA